MYLTHAAVRVDTVCPYSFVGTMLRRVGPDGPASPQRIGWRWGENNMRVRDVLASRKTIIDAGTWKDGKMPPAAFPLSKSPLNVNKNYRWRCVAFTCCGASFRVLLFYRLGIQKFSSYLGRHDGKNMTVLARYEWHGTHEGWHFHVPRTCDDSEQTSGRPGGCDLRIPNCSARHRRMIFGVVNDDTAFKVAFHAFRLASPSDDFELQGQQDGH
jgi:hypothetical protein